MTDQEALARAWREGWNARKEQELRHAARLPTTSAATLNPYKGCPCPACTRAGDA